MVRTSSCQPHTESPVVVRAIPVSLKTMPKPACSHWTTFECIVLGRRRQLISLLIDPLLPQVVRGSAALAGPQSGL